MLAKLKTALADLEAAVKAGDKERIITFIHQHY